LSVEGEVGGAPFEGDQKLEAGMSALELSQLMEIATERPCRIVGDAVDRLRRGESRIEVCVGIGDGAVAVGYKSLRIVELIEKRRASAGDEISNEI